MGLRFILFMHDKLYISSFLVRFEWWDFFALSNLMFIKLKFLTDFTVDFLSNVIYNFFERDIITSITSLAIISASFQYASFNLSASCTDTDLPYLPCHHIGQLYRYRLALPPLPSYRPVSSTPLWTCLPVVPIQTCQTLSVQRLAFLSQGSSST